MGTKNLTSKEIIKTLKEHRAILKKYDVKKIAEDIERDVSYV